MLAREWLIRMEVWPVCRQELMTVQNEVQFNAAIVAERSPPPSPSLLPSRPPLPPLVGRLTLSTLQRSLCLLCPQVIVYMLSDINRKKTTTAHCSVPMIKLPSDEAAPSY